MRLATLLSFCAIGYLACYRERERFDIPELEVIPASRVIAPNDTLRGVVRAADGSGLETLTVFATSSIDTIRQEFFVADRHRVEFMFRIPVSAETPAGTRIAIRAVVLDDQNFQVVKHDTVVVAFP
ncbi:MAG: hypothetical protein H7Z74_06110 [Anaerolineae bacterium]|nr:hypothetical protein [Gemmatimonadaceae bacterium]